MSTSIISLDQNFDANDVDIVIRYTYRTDLSVILSIKLRSFLKVPNKTLDQLRYLCLYIFVNIILLFHTEVISFDTKKHR